MSLAAFVLRRVLWSIPIVLLVMLATFALMRGAGGTPFRPPEGIPGLPAPLQKELTDFYHLDEPWLVEFAYYVKNVFTLEFGPSLVNRYVSVDDVVENAFPVTGELILLSAAWAVPLGILLGLLAALRPGGLISGPTQMGFADMAAYALVLAHIGPVAMAVTSALNYQFLRPCRPGPLFADAHMLRLGRRLAVMDVRIWTDDADKPVGQANVTYAIP